MEQRQQNANKITFVFSMPNRQKREVTVFFREHERLDQIFERTFAVEKQPQPLGYQYTKIEGMKSGSYHFFITVSSGKRGMPYVTLPNGQKLYLDMRHMSLNSMHSGMVVEMTVVSACGDMPNSYKKRVDNFYDSFELEALAQKIERILTNMQLFSGPDYLLQKLLRQAHAFDALERKRRHKFFDFPTPAVVYSKPDLGTHLPNQPVFPQLRANSVFAIEMPEEIQMQIQTLPQIQAQIQKPIFPQLRANSAFTIETPEEIQMQIQTLPQIQAQIQTPIPSVTSQSGFLSFPVLQETCVQEQPDSGLLEMPPQAVQPATPVRAPKTRIPALGGARIQNPPRNTAPRNKSKKIKRNNFLNQKKTSPTMHQKPKMQPFKLSFTKPIPLSSIKELRAVIFDLDGVVVNSMELHRRSFNVLLAQLGIKISKAHFRRNCGGRNSHKIMKDLFEMHGISKSAVEWDRKRTALYFKYLKNYGVKPVEGFREFHAMLKENGIKVAIASAGHEGHIKAALYSIGVRNIPIIAIEHVRGAGKPKPDLFFKAAKRLKVNHWQVLVFEDSPNGMEAAARAKMPCIALATSLPKRLIAKRAAIVVKNFCSPSLKRLFARLTAKSQRR